MVVLKYVLYLLQQSKSFRSLILNLQKEASETPELTKFSCFDFFFLYLLISYLKKEEKEKKERRKSSLPLG